MAVHGLNQIDSLCIRLRGRLLGLNLLKNRFWGLCGHTSRLSCTNLLFSICKSSLVSIIALNIFTTHLSVFLLFILSLFHSPTHMHVCASLSYCLSLQLIGRSLELWLQLLISCLSAFSYRATAARPTWQLWVKDARCYSDLTAGKKSVLYTHFGNELIKKDHIQGQLRKITCPMYTLNWEFQSWMLLPVSDNSKWSESD